MCLPFASSRVYIVLWSALQIIWFCISTRFWVLQKNNCNLLLFSHILCLWNGEPRNLLALDWINNRSWLCQLKSCSYWKKRCCWRVVAREEKTTIYHGVSYSQISECSLGSGAPREDPHGGFHLRSLWKSHMDLERSGRTLRGRPQGEEQAHLQSLWLLQLHRGFAKTTYSASAHERHQRVPMSAVWLQDLRSVNLCSSREKPSETILYLRALWQRMFHTAGIDKP